MNTADFLIIFIPGLLGIFAFLGLYICYISKMFNDTGLATGFMLVIIAVIFMCLLFGAIDVATTEGTNAT